LNLVILHYHLRPGGVRRIIELATPQIVRAADGAITSVIVASGERSDRKWRELFIRDFDGVEVKFFVEPSFGYFSEQR